MTWSSRGKNRAEEPVKMEELDPAMRQALGEFKASVHAWSDAAHNQPRTMRALVVRRSWRVVAGWSFAVVLAAGTISGGFYEHHQHVVAAQLAAQRAAEQQRAEAARRALDQAQKDEELLASVDKTVSREVPSAMEPLAQLAAESETQ